MMKQTVVMMMVLSGLCFLPACFPHIYTLVKKVMTWADAKDYCRNTYTDLAAAHNEQEVVTIRELTKNLQGVWIGLQPETEAWRWSLENQDYYGEGEAEFRMWAYDEPKGVLGLYKMCVGLLGNGKWSDQLCGAVLPFFCYYKDTSSFIYVNVLKTWASAQSYCRQHYTDLASVRNQSENEQLREMMNSSFTWISLYRNSWKWSDGTTYSFSNWEYKKTSTVETDACGVTYAGKWYNDICNTLHNFICYTAMKDKKVLKVVLNKTDASVDLDKLQEDILEKEKPAPP